MQTDTHVLFHWVQFISKNIVKNALLLLLLFSSLSNLKSQILNDNFTDGNYTALPTWSGGNTVTTGDGFTVNAGFQLQTNLPNGGAGTRIAYLSTPTAFNLNADNWEWLLETELLFTQIPNATNNSRLYLVSDNANLNGALNGYFLELREVLTFYRQDGTTLTPFPLSSATNFGTAPFLVEIRVIRTLAGVWKIYANGVLQGSVTENTYTNSSFFGVNYRYSANARRNDFILDFVTIQPYIDNTPPTLLNVQGASPNQIVLTFDEDIEPNSIQVSDFSVNLGLGTPLTATLEVGSTDKIRLTFANNFTTATNYTITVQNVNDIFGNTILTTNQNFSFNDNLPPIISELTVTSPSSLDVLFSENVELLSAQNVGNYTKNLGVPNPVSAVRDAANQRLVHLVFSDNFAANITHTLTVNNVADQNTNAITIPVNANFVYDTQRPDVCVSGCVIPLSNNQILVQFSEPVELISAQIVNHYEWLGFGFPTSAIRNPNNFSQVTLSFSGTFVPQTPYELRIRNVTDFLGNVMTTRTRAFVYDPLPPSVLNLTILNNNTLELQFSELLTQATAENIANYTLNNAIGNPTTATLLPFDATRVRLFFAGGLADVGNYILTVENVTDLTNNPLSPAQNLPFSTQIPSIAKAEPLANNLLRVTFSEPITNATAQNAANYNVSGIGIAINAVQVSPAVVELTFSNNFAIGTSYSLTVQNIQDLFSNTLISQTKNFVYQPRIVSVTPITPTLIDVLFNYPPVPISVQNAALYEIDNAIGTALAANLDANNNQLVHVALGAALAPNTNYTLDAGYFDLQNEEIAPRSTHTFNLDNAPPTVTQVRVLSDNSLEITFSEGVENTTALAFNHYQVAGFGLPTATTFLASNRIRVVFNQNFGFGITYSITISNVRDLEGNPMVAQTIAFSRPPVPPANSLIITELMADEVPQVGLPATEYLEIYNASNTAQNLFGVQVGTSSLSTIQADFVLQPNQYVVLCPQTALDSFAVYGNAIALSPWRALTNTSGTVRIVGADNSLISQLNYSDSWYQDATKENGGWSLEMIDLTPPCYTRENWRASLDPLGGTPATQNSVFGDNPDNIAPQLSELVIIPNDTLLLTFSESIDSLLLVNTAFYSLNNGLSVSQIFYLSPTQVRLKLNATLNSDLVYTLTINNLADCAGNAQPIVREFGIGATPQLYDIIITEIMADEDPQVELPRAEYLEILNKSSNPINLATIRLFDATSSVILPNYLILPNQYLTLTATSRVDSFLVQNINAIGVSNFPSLNNSGELLRLMRTNDSALVFKVDYKSSWYQDATKANGGWSLEMIDINNLCGEAQNWRASIDARGGTPSQVNSVAASNPDTEAPLLVEFSFETEVRLRLVFNENVDSLAFMTLSNYSFNPNLNISGLEYQNPKEIVLLLGAAPNSSTIYTLTINNLVDCAGNSLSQTLQVGRGRSPQRYEILITELMARETPPVGLPAVKYIEIHNVTDDLLSLDGVTIRDNSSVGRLPNRVLLPNSYIILTTTTRVDSFAVRGIEAVGVPSLPTLTFSGKTIALYNSQNALIQEVSYSDTWYRDANKANGGWSLEMIDLNNVCEGAQNWRASQDPLGGTPARANSVAAPNPDTTLPFAERFVLVSDTELDVIFSEKIDSLSLVNSAHYQIQTGISINQLVWINNNTVRLRFSPALAENILYRLVISAEIADCAGNRAASEKVFEFGKGVVPAAYELLITEIMADPTPTVGLPAREYLEIYNPTDKILALGQVMIVDGSNTTLLPDEILMPNEYLTICATSSAAELRDFGRVLGVSRFPSLTIAGKLLKLQTISGAYLYEVFYSDTWYGDVAKEEGGWSLEMIDPTNFCGEAQNWRASIDPSGGTPSRQNSVFAPNPDTEAPQIQSLTLSEDRNALLIVFNEKVDSLSALNPAHYSIDNNLSVLQIEWLSAKSVRLFLSPAAAAEVLYTLTIQNIRDCAENTQMQSLVFGAGASPSFGELLITEILPDPSPVVSLPESEYIELYNPTNKIISLNGVSLFDGNNKIVLPPLVLLPQEYLLLVPNSVRNQFLSYGKVAGLTTWLSLTNSGKLLRLSNAAEALVFEVTYSDAWYGDAEKKEGGWSLEMIDPSQFCIERENWTASRDARGGTPAQRNSVYALSGDRIQPKLLRAEAIDNQKIRLIFDEKLDSLQIAFAQIEIAPLMPISAQYVENGNWKNLIIELSAPLQTRTRYEVRLQNLTDCAGNLVSDLANSAFVVLPEAAEIGDLLINEILFNPPTFGVDFVEIYNHSDKFIDLKGYKIANTNLDGNATNPSSLNTIRNLSSETLILAPQAYIALTSDSLQLLNQYPNGNRAGFWQMSSLPSYSDEEGEVVLLDFQDKELDRFRYHEDFHFDLIRDQNGVSLERIDFEAPTNDPNNWHSAASTVGFGTPAYRNSQAKELENQGISQDCFRVEGEVITPDADGVNDFAQIFYDCNVQGQMVNISIYDAMGRKVRDLVQNQLAATSGFITWDGTDNRSQKVRVGYYLLLIELYDLNGSVQYLKKKIAVAAKF
ncbi:lamin tail domain-containing protein [Hugenholtzia roseola]|uniref:lamin tail domain-containing protein n=1 Tax=Hugenholtzia roseola TaxID=1002 RepID=UPI00047CF1D1|nr:lamin tail domain-containing protein [Hugenholtzia roseola]